MKPFEGKTAVVLGGNSGIGLATAKALALQGAAVRFTGRDASTLTTARQEIGGDCRSYCVDIAELSAMDAFYAEIGTEDGGIDILHVNAGVGGFGRLRSLTEEVWDRVHSVNLKGCVFAMQKAAPLMRAGGAIVVTGSIGAHAAVPGYLAYASAKSGLHAAMKIIARELVSEGIRVNMVSPGPVDTPLLYRNPGKSRESVDAFKERVRERVPMRRMGSAEEIADAVVFLASDQASYITGANLYVDGGALELR